MRVFTTLSRRYFIRRILLGLAALGLPLLRPGTPHAALNFWRSSEYVGKTRDGRYKDFYIQYYKSFKRIDGDAWRLNVTGACENPQVLTLETLKAFPRKKQVSRLKCVECWSAKAEWEGFAMADLDALVRPRPEAVGLLFHCADSYIEYLPLEDLRHARTLWVHRMNGEPLSDEHGFPLRMIVPFKYGYKNPKAIVAVEYLSQADRGTWNRIGPYSVDGTILPGYDHPLDRGKQRRRISGGEIFD